MKKAILTALSFLIIGLLIRELILIWPDAVVYIVGANAWLLSVSVVLYGVGFFLNGFAWCYILRQIDDRIPLLECLNIQFTTAFARYIPGGIWSMVGKAVTCRNLGVRTSDVNFSILIEYAFIASTAASFALLIIFQSSLPLLWIGAGLLGLLLLAALVFCLCYRWIKNIKLFQMLVAAVQKFSIPQLAKIAGIYLTSWCLIGFGFMVLGQAFFAIDLFESIKMIGLYPVSWVIGFLSPFPNGMGVREWCIKVFMGASYAAEVTILVSVLSRLWATVSECLMFALFKGYYLCKRQLPKQGE